MSKSRRDNRGFTREQKLLNENTKLKRQISQLRKQLCRVDLDRYSHIRDIVEQHYQEDRAQEGQEFLDKVADEWKCHSCGQGHLEIFCYNKLDTTWYYRVCSNSDNCTHRTKPQIYDPKKVKGILKKSPPKV